MVSLRMRAYWDAPRARGWVEERLSSYEKSSTHVRQAIPVSVLSLFALPPLAVGFGLSGLIAAHVELEQTVQLLRQTLEEPGPIRYLPRPGALISTSAPIGAPINEQTGFQYLENLTLDWEPRGGIYAAPFQDIQILAKEPHARADLLVKPLRDGIVQVERAWLE